MSSLRRPAPTQQHEGAEVRLLLRAHAEANWLTSRVIPVLRELERETRGKRRYAGTTIAYLEMLWIEACGRAAETDGARVELDAHGRGGGDALQERARRFHAAVRRTRADTARRVARLTDPRRHLAARHGARG
jgi:hypothetical protein